MKFTKLIFGISVLVSWSLLTAIFIVGLQNLDQKQVAASASGSSNASSAVSGSGIILSASEVAKHNSISDCWTIINGKVYDLAQYAGAHPGGTATVLEICGIDGTSLFANQPHSSRASSILDSYYIGDLNQNVSPSALASVAANVPATTPTIPRNRYEDYEDD